MDSELMRAFLILLCKNKPGGEIKVGMDSIGAISENDRLEFYRDGPLMCLRVHVVKDEWGRVIDRCGQIKCGTCDVYVNYCYSDGSKRTHCSSHE